MKAIIKLILGWALIVLSVTGIYGVGKLRQHIEYKFNNGNEFNFFFPDSVSVKSYWILFRKMTNETLYLRKTSTSP